MLLAGETLEAAMPGRRHLSIGLIESSQNLSKLLGEVIDDVAGVGRRRLKLGVGQESPLEQSDGQISLRHVSAPFEPVGDEAWGAGAGEVPLARHRGGDRLSEVIADLSDVLVDLFNQRLRSEAQCGEKSVAVAPVRLCWCTLEPFAVQSSRNRVRNLNFLQPPACRTPTLPFLRSVAPRKASGASGVDACPRTNRVLLDSPRLLVRVL